MILNLWMFQRVIYIENNVKNDRNVNNENNENNVSNGNDAA